MTKNQVVFWKQISSSWFKKELKEIKQLRRFFHLLLQSTSPNWNKIEGFQTITIFSLTATNITISFNHTFLQDGSKKQRNINWHINETVRTS